MYVKKLGPSDLPKKIGSCGSVSKLSYPQKIGRRILKHDCQKKEFEGKVRAMRPLESQISLMTEVPPIDGISRNAIAYLGKDSLTPQTGAPSHHHRNTDQKTGVFRMANSSLEVRSSSKLGQHLRSLSGQRNGILRELPVTKAAHPLPHPSPARYIGTHTKFCYTHALSPLLHMCGYTYPPP